MSLIPEKRKLASIQVIEDIKPIPNRDRIGLARVLGWDVIVAIADFHVGDKCVYVEIDSVLPEKPEFEFLRPKNFRIRTMKMAGVLSQGICFPLSILPEKEWNVGDDVTEVIGVKHYDEYVNEREYEERVQGYAPPKKSKFRSWLFKHCKPLAILLYGGTKKEKGGFPEFISKTDEQRCQLLPYFFTPDKDEFVFLKRDFVVTEKLDGQSMTVFLRKREGLFGGYDFGVCSRNLRLMKPDGSSYWNMVIKYRLEEVLKELLKAGGKNTPWVCLQGEVIGEKIQGNPYGLIGNDFYAFNLIYPDDEYPDNPARNIKIDSATAARIVEPMGIKWVPILDCEFRLPDSVDDMVAYADGKSVLADVDREGVVIRNGEYHISFKAVSNKYLLKHEK